MIKQREELEKIYADAGRAELANKRPRRSSSSANICRSSSPTRRCEKAIAEAIAKTGAASIKDMGKVMAELKAKYAGQMDFAKASAVVKAKLG